MVESITQHAQSADARTPIDTRPTSYLTIRQLSAVTTLSVSTLRRLVKQGFITGHQPGGYRHRIVFPPSAIEQVARASSPQAAPPQQTTAHSPPNRPQHGPRPRWTRASSTCDTSRKQE